MTNNKYKILVVEDETNINNVLSALLDANGYKPICAKNCADAKMLYSSYKPDLIILDLGLPDGDGTELLKEIRHGNLTPVIVLSARAEEHDKVHALDLGANDYVTKPFGTDELMARIRSALRTSTHRSDDSKIPGGKFESDGLIIDYDSRRVFINESEIKLTQTEYNIIALLSEHAGKVMTYSSIIKEVWGFCDSNSIKRLQVNMAHIRSKFGERPGEKNFIVNELGVGYRFCDRLEL